MAYLLKTDEANETEGEVERTFKSDQKQMKRTRSREKLKETFKSDQMVHAMAYSTMQPWEEMLTFTSSAFSMVALFVQLEAAAVNLVAGEKPADVYSEIAARVHDIMVRDSNKDPATSPNALLAKLLIGQVDRKLVKQTVMTSVYGVTYVGAREQIKRRLEEKGQITDDGLLFNAACYAAKIIALENQPVRWTTPLGLPVVQPYFKTERHVIRTSLQVLALQREGDSVEVRKQRTTFPPNFVHSLDGSHMMMTAVACRDAGLRFAGVHDSFWTHACDVDRMNRIIREKFVELYRTSILEDGNQSVLCAVGFQKLKSPVSCALLMSGKDRKMLNSMDSDSTLLILLGAKLGVTILHSFYVLYSFVFGI
ncbi:hypothetical protein TEA_004809 [Camellia sinensis var. sinensis]|uniref:DNA-directed RNA polymerase n=1 Tax=Camellia sinensis var. sinensis TaxID=542762 RepID=A0A4S4D913_CAMSN|nr:hypothetical protein TEA_004809 [Camellia sinensis var. sinensis]